MVIIIFPTKAESRLFIKKLSRVSKPKTIKKERPFITKYEIKGKEFLVMVTGMGREILKAVEAIPPGEGSLIILTGVAKALNQSLQVGDVVSVKSVKKENEKSIIDIPLSPFPRLQPVTLVTCDRFVFHSAEEGDLADREGYYLAQRIKNLCIVKAVSDKEENIEFLNKYCQNGKSNIKGLLFSLSKKQFITLIKFFLNSRLARKKLSDFLFKNLC